MCYGCREQVSHPTIKAILCGPDEEGFFAEIPELMLKAYAAEADKKACRLAGQHVKQAGVQDRGALERWGDHLVRVGRYRKAIRCYRTLLQQRARDPAVLFKKIIAEFDAKRYSAVIQNVPEALKQVSEEQKLILIFYRIQAYEALQQFEKGEADKQYLIQKGFTWDRQAYTCPAWQKLRHC